MPNLTEFAEMMARSHNWEMAGDHKAARDFAHAAMLALFGVRA